MDKVVPEIQTKDVRLAMEDWAERRWYGMLERFEFQR
jgi:hypothetical protein